MNRSINNKNIALMYHGIISAKYDLLEARNGVPSEYDIDVKDFEKQLEWISQHKKDVVITFDDGELNVYKNAFPVLKRLRIKAYLFIVAKCIGAPGVMTNSQIKELSDYGMIIGSHSLTHCVLTELSDLELKKELRESKRILEAITGKEVLSLSVPMGFYDRRTIEFAMDAGYKEIFVSEYLAKFANNCVKRISVRRGWSLEYFKRILCGQYSGISIAKNVVRQIVPLRAQYLLKRLIKFK